MIDVSQVTACLVTRGDVDMAEIIDSLPFERVVIYDNSREPDLQVMGRYQAVARAHAGVCFVQDDDCVLEPEAFDMLLAAYQPERVIANMPLRFREHYPDSCLVGFGALFDGHLPIIAFGNFLLRLGYQPQASLMHRECDSIFTTLTPRVLVDAPYHDLPWASDPTRLWTQPDHVGLRKEMLQLVRTVRDA